jgi:hypothetical protein
MSTTDSSAISKLIADAQGQVFDVLPINKPLPPLPKPRMLPAGTSGPWQPQPAAPARTQPRAPSTGLGHEEWFESQIEADDAPPTLSAVGTPAPAPVAPRVAHPHVDRTQPIELAEMVPVEMPVDVPVDIDLGTGGFGIPEAITDEGTEMVGFAPATAKRSKKGMWIAGGVTLAAIGAVVAVVAINQDGGSSKASKATASKPAALGLATTPAVKELAVTRMVTQPAPTAAAPSVTPLQPAVSYTGAFDIPGIAADTRVMLDGNALGQGPMHVAGLATGKHHIDLINAQGEEKSLDVDLESNQIAQIDLGNTEQKAEEPAPAPAPAQEKVEEKVAAPAPAAEKEVAVDTNVDAVQPAVAVEAPKPAAKHVAAKPAPTHVAPTAPVKRLAAREIDRDPPAPKTHIARPAALPAPTADEGVLMLAAKPPCQIIIDGRNTGLFTPQRALPVAAGKHQVTLVNKQFDIKRTKTVHVAAGEPTKLIVDLTDEMN